MNDEIYIFTPTDEQIARQLPRRLILAPLALHPTDESDSPYYKFHKSGQVGLRCPSCLLTWTKWYGFKKLESRVAKTFNPAPIGDDGKTDFFECLSAINRKKENNCIDCPICKSDNQLMTLMTHNCQSNDIQPHQCRSGSHSHAIMSIPRMFI
jgi:hypothetical protein